MKVKLQGKKQSLELKQNHLTSCFIQHLIKRRWLQVKSSVLHFRHPLAQQQVKSISQRTKQNARMNPVKGLFLSVLRHPLRILKGCMPQKESWPFAAVWLPMQQWLRVAWVQLVSQDAVKSRSMKLLNILNWAATRSWKVIIFPWMAPLVKSTLETLRPLRHPSVVHSEGLWLGQTASEN